MLSMTSDKGWQIKAVKVEGTKNRNYHLLFSSGMSEKRVSFDLDAHTPIFSQSSETEATSHNEYKILE